MSPDEIVHKSDMLVSEGGGDKEKKVSMKGGLANNHGPTTYRECMDTLLMVVSIVWRTCFGVAGPLGS